MAVSKVCVGVFLLIRMNIVETGHSYSGQKGSLVTNDVNSVCKYYKRIFQKTFVIIIKDCSNLLQFFQ